MHEYTNDAMTYVRVYGQPDLFITFICNSEWPEIQELLWQKQYAADRHNIIARVCKQKLLKLIKVITKFYVFGETNRWMYTVEWQKRGLPHAHILKWLKDKIPPENIDDIISAELSDQTLDPILFEIVSKNMIHGPCGPLNTKSPCMKDEKCIKRYPRQLLMDTQTDRDGYPLYRRRSPNNGGYAITVCKKKC